MNPSEIMSISKAKKSWLCKIGFHQFETVTETVGFIDCGNSVLKHEETWIECVREGCNKMKTAKVGNWVEFKKKE